MSLNEEIASVSRKLRLRSLAVQPERFTLADQTQLKKLHRGLRLVHAPAMIGGMRRIKGPTELAAMTKAIRVAEESFLVLRATIRPGDTELQLAARLEYEMKCRGASDASFATICAIDDHAALPHARPGARKVKRGSAILFDWGATVGWYHSDLTRMVFVDTLSRRLGEVYRIVLEAQARAIAAIRPGARMCDVDAVARDFIKASGYGERFGHGLGHGLGLEVHEPPSLSWRSDEPLAAGMVVTVEPGIYLPGVGGVRIEDDVVVTETGCRVMTSLSKKMDDCRLTIRGVAKSDSQSTIDNLKC
jgi:Xaa-Pro aminopeptidase